MEVTLFLCGDVMTGRGVDQVLAYACPPHLYESHAASARDYVALAERVCGRITGPLSPAELWADAREPLARASPDARIVNLETSVTLCEDAQPKRINYRMHPGNVPCLTAARLDACARTAGQDGA